MKLAIWISPLGWKAYIGKLNKKWNERLSKEEMSDDMVDHFVLAYLERELGNKSEGFNWRYSHLWEPKCIRITWWE